MSDNSVRYIVKVGAEYVRANLFTESDSELVEEQPRAFKCYSLPFAYAVLNDCRWKWPTARIVKLRKKVAP